MKNVALVLAGLLAGTLAGALFVPRVLAQGVPPAPPSAPLKWQQFCEPAGSIAEASTMAGARGAEGWELVGFFGAALCFKRPLTVVGAPPPPPPGSASASWPGY